MVHHFGTRTCLYTGVFFETLSLIGASFAKEKYQIVLAQGLCFGYGMGFLFVGSVPIPAQWFDKKRSLANAIGAAGSGMGGLTYSLATQAMIDRIGLPWAFRILGICAFTVNFICSTLLRDRNKQTGSVHKAFTLTLIKRPEFVLLQGWSYFSMLGYVALLFSLPSYGRAIGLTASQGSLVGALLNLGQMLFRPMMGLLSDKLGRINIALLFTILCAISCFAFWIPCEASGISRMGLLSFFAIVGGGMSGVFWSSIAPVAAEVVGLKDLPTALSMTWVLMVPPTTVAEPTALELRRPGPSPYLNTQIFVAMMYSGAALCLCLVRGWRVGEIERIENELQKKGADPAKIREVEEKRAQGQFDEDKGADQTWKPADLLRRVMLVKVKV